MDRLSFWLHMNDEYMWQWFCCQSDGVTLAQSARSFFYRADAEDALHVARSVIGHISITA
jgi:hypothetical protein